jgi:hypothetical protein
VIVRSQNGVQLTLSSVYSFIGPFFNRNNGHTIPFAEVGLFIVSYTAVDDIVSAQRGVSCVPHRARQALGPRCLVDGPDL